jgi:release factor glutamine methyltransferase
VTQDVWTTVKLLSWTKDFLSSKGVANSRLEAEWLLCAATGLDRVGLYLAYDRPLNSNELASYKSMVTRRAKREPLQHILGTQEFSGIDFKVSADVLIPRHDTEVLVEEAVKKCPDPKTILDLGTGSGCIAIALQKILSNAVVTATDISEAALTIARYNAQVNCSPVQFLYGSLFTPVYGKCFDLIVSNPPYIPTAEIDALEAEVRDYDPRIALDGGLDGLDIYKKLIPEGAEYINPGGWLIVEIGFNQSDAVIAIFNNSCKYEVPFMVKDSSGFDRVIGAKRKVVL